MSIVTTVLSAVFNQGNDYVVKQFTIIHYINQADHSKFIQSTSNQKKGAGLFVRNLVNIRVLV